MSRIRGARPGACTPPLPCGSSCPSSSAAQHFPETKAPPCPVPHTQGAGAVATCRQGGPGCSRAEACLGPAGARRRLAGRCQRPAPAGRPGRAAPGSRGSSPGCGAGRRGRGGPAAPPPPLRARRRKLGRFQSARSACINIVSLRSRHAVHFKFRLHRPLLAFAKGMESGPGRPPSHTRGAEARLVAFCTRG